MEAHKFTPGPWDIRENEPGKATITMLDESETGLVRLSHIAYCHDHIHPEHDGSYLANAALIAAAPDLHAALVRCLDDLRGFQVLTGDTNDRQSITAAKAALKLAGGGQ